VEACVLIHFPQLQYSREMSCALGLNLLLLVVTEAPALISAMQPAKVVCPDGCITPSMYSQKHKLSMKFYRVQSFFICLFIHF
jgi:hypothetical protein